MGPAIERCSKEYFAARARGETPTRFSVSKQAWNLIWSDLCELDAMSSRSPDPARPPMNPLAPPDTTDGCILMGLPIFIDGRAGDEITCETVSVSETAP